MSANQPKWPREWLMTDERIGTRLWDALDALPAAQAGIVFRHYSTPAEERVPMAHRVARLCRERDLTLAVGRDTDLAFATGAQLIHNPTSNPAGLPISCSAHSLEEADAACIAGATLIFLSPIFPTRSHAGQAPIPRTIAREIVGACQVPVIALGGMNRTRFAAIVADGFYGWAGIDAWLGV